MSGERKFAKNLTGKGTAAKIRETASEALRESVSQVSFWPFVVTFCCLDIAHFCWHLSSTVVDCIYWINHTELPYIFDSMTSVTLSGKYVLFVMWMGSMCLWMKCECCLWYFGIWEGPRVSAYQSCLCLNLVSSVWFAQIQEVVLL